MEISLLFFEFADSTIFNGRFVTSRRTWVDVRQGERGGRLGLPFSEMPWPPLESFALSFCNIVWRSLSTTLKPHSISTEASHMFLKIKQKLCANLLRRLSELVLSTAWPHLISGQVLSNHSIVSSSSTVKLGSPWWGRWIRHRRTTWSTVCSCLPHLQAAVGVIPRANLLKGPLNNLFLGPHLQVCLGTLNCNIHPCRGICILQLLSSELNKGNRFRCDAASYHKSMLPTPQKATVPKCPSEYTKARK